MWGYYNGNAMSISEIHWFKTKEELDRFIQLLFQRNVELYPNEPDMWNPLGEDARIIIKTSPVVSAEQVVSEWFGE